MNLEFYKDFLKTNYPQTFQFLNQTQWTPLFFNESIELSVSIYQQIEKTVQSLYQLKNNTAYQKKLLYQYKLNSKKANHSKGRLNSRSHENRTFQKNHNNKTKQMPLGLESKNQDSILMAYDFHLSGSAAKLIEVNTNASAFLLVNSFYQIKNLNYKQALEALRHSFQQEWIKFNTKKKRPKKIVLIDEKPFNQKMIIEFFMYKDFFKSMEWDMEILDSNQLKTDEKHFLYTPKDEKIDFIYNRSTDFYFENHPLLAKAYQKNTCLILPQPKDYFLLADKTRMTDWLAENWTELKAVKNNLLKTIILNSDNKQQLWEKRKQYFFKISQGHGGKLAYRGASLSRKKFEELFQYNCLAQEYTAPSKITDSNGKEWKLDLRAYVYKDQIQQIACRVYQGQLTNFKELGSGFAVVELV